MVLTQTELGGFREPMEEFIGIATAELRRLYAQVAGSDYVVILTDANGVAVDYLGQASFEQELKQAGLYLGSVWAEAQEGTNGVGTCIATREPLIVHRQEHFRALHTGTDLHRGARSSIRPARCWACSTFPTCRHPRTAAARCWPWNWSSARPG